MTFRGKKGVAKTNSTDGRVLKEKTETGIHGSFHIKNHLQIFPPYPRNFVPGGPSWRILLTKLSPSLRGGGALGRWSLL